MSIKDTHLLKLVFNNRKRTHTEYFQHFIQLAKRSLQTKGQTGRAAANTLGYQQGLFHSNGTQTLEM